MADIKRKSKPTDAKEFDRSREVTKGIFILGIVFQLISMISEGMGLGAYAYRAFPFFGFILAAIVIVIIVASWEIGIRSCAEYVFDTVIKWIKDRSTITIEGFTLWFVVLAVTFGLTYYSFDVSKKNSHVAIEAVSPIPEIANDSTIRNKYIAEFNNLDARYQEKANNIKSRYSDLIRSENQKNTSELAIYDAKIQKYNKLEKNTNKKYTGRKDYYNNKKLNASKGLSENLLSIKSQESIELQNLDSWKAQQDTILSNARDAELMLFQKTNSTKVNNSIKWNELISWLISNLAAYSVILALLCILFNTIRDNQVGRTVEYEKISEDDEGPIIQKLQALIKVKMFGPLNKWLDSELDTERAKKKGKSFSPISEQTTTRGHRERVEEYEKQVGQQNLADTLESEADTLGESANKSNTESIEADTLEPTTNKKPTEANKNQQSFIETLENATKKAIGDAQNRVITTTNTKPTEINQQPDVLALSEKVDKLEADKKKMEEELSAIQKADKKKMEANKKEEANQQLTEINNIKIINNTTGLPFVEHKLQNGEVKKYTLSQVQGTKSTYRKRMLKALDSGKNKVYQNNKKNYELFEKYEQALKAMESNL